MAPKLELNLVGDLPANLDLKPTMRMILTLNQLEPDWLQTGVINLKLVDDAAIQALNKDYSGNDYATDVLSFSYLEDDAFASQVKGQMLKVKGYMSEESTELGDMVISFETATRQAQAAGTSLGDEVATLALHGILHIHGFDHQGARDRQKLDQLQLQILQQSGVTYRDFNWLSSD